MWYDANMPAKPVQVSIDADLLRRIDPDPETSEKGRSAFIRSAVSSYLEAKRRKGRPAIAAPTGAPKTTWRRKSRAWWTPRHGPATEPYRDLAARASPSRQAPPGAVFSRPSLIAALNTVTVAAITSTRRGSPTEVELGVEEGLKGPCCVNLCNVFTVAQGDLRQFVGTVSPDKMRAVCRALSIATACD